VELQLILHSVMNLILTDFVCSFIQLARLNSKLLMSSHASSRAFQFQSSSENVFVLQDDARMLTEIARDAVNELVTLASSNAPMWISVSGGSLETLNKMDYVQAFSGLSSAMGHDMEATRANAMVMLDSKSIVEAVMDAVSCCLS
jgi:homeobox-leucine zipper protein